MRFSAHHPDLAGLLPDLLPTSASPSDFQLARKLGVRLETVLPRREGRLLEVAVIDGVAADHLPVSDSLLRLRTLARVVSLRRIIGPTDTLVCVSAGILLDCPIHHLVAAARTLRESDEGRIGSVVCRGETIRTCRIAQVRGSQFVDPVRQKP